MKTYVIRFVFNRGALHIGTPREDYTRSESILHSDTLYAAILQAWSMLGVTHPLLAPRKKQEMGDQYGPIPPLGFALSSLFPFSKKEDDSLSYFFPVPTGGVTVPSNSNNRKLDKKVKSLRFLDAPAFVEWLKNGKVSPIDLQAHSLQGEFYRSDATDSNWEDVFLKRDVHPRAHIPREGAGESDTTIYYIERLFFREGSGFFCLAHFDDEDIRKKVLLALRHLEDEGLGTDRHVGHGQFELEGPEPFVAFDNLAESDFSLNLSLFCPKDEHEFQQMTQDEKKTRFELVKRGGWITTEPWLTYRKNSVWMLREGAILQTKDAIAGKTIDLQPDILKGEQKAVWRVGQSLFVPVHKP